ncbi:probable methyltransferase-like protein 25 [Danaus plexippus]|uniref:probable methyltransferase-like protein 25 n=1 Tax=Danaus plexippus TaxID=13037 RepID=UPI002AB07EF2|nr:probable methyltransferase-like protein 25 [Danaus plexippus]
MTLKFLFNRIKKFSMESSIAKVKCDLDAATTFLDQYLHLANCHMVEFFTESHWDRLVPKKLRNYLDVCELSQAIDNFWKYADGNCCDDNELNKWIKESRKYYTALNTYCISTEKLQEIIKSWGGEIKPQVQITEFMTSKKSYEVKTMSHLIASLCTVCDVTHCVEAGGGKGNLPVALSLSYHLPSLTIDCNPIAVNNGEKRVKIIQKQWHAISKKVKDGSKHLASDGIETNLHRFAAAYITTDTDFARLVREKYPEYSGDVKLLLTGLHTCGNLGPDSLVIFTTNPSISSLFNVPCCYHLLTEDVDVELFDVFQRYGDGCGGSKGFPMSEGLKGYNLGRNARMLAAQSIHRVVYNKQIPDKGLLYRALIQVIIKQRLPGLPVSEGKLKGISSKCQNFDDYAKMADAILKIGVDQNSEIFLEVQKDIDVKWKKIVMFYLLRLCLAQVIENVILLDRLLFLLENGFQKCFLVKLFDPVTSPRCHGLVAVRCRMPEGVEVPS